jgi:O-antigen ligase
MSRLLSLTACIVFIVYLFRLDAKRKINISYALWIPWVWFTITASRAVSTWFGMGVVGESSDYYLEGSPFDRNVAIALIVIGIIILYRRRVSWVSILKKNKFIFIYILYLGLSALLWSDYTFVSFKRWIKELGHIIMVLIVITEAEPVEAFKTMIKRCAYVLIPLSIVVNRYFPEISRIYSIGGGDPMFAGVTTNKNSLGALCMVCSIVIFWSFLTAWRNRNEKKESNDMAINLILLVMIAFLLYSARSATSFAAALIGISIVTILNMNMFRNNVNSIKYYAFAAVITLLIIHFSFDIMALTTSGLGRDETLTGRTEFWEELIKMGTNPLVGTGYESFWMGDRIAFFWDKYWWHPNQAHNGYLEIYLNLGYIGLTLLIGIILSTLKTIFKNISALNNYDYQVLRIAFLAIIVAINITEANFKGFIWLIFLSIAIEMPTTEKQKQSSQNS